MNPFIRSADYHFIRQQARLLANAHGTISDASVIKAVASLAEEKVTGLFPNLTEEQKELLLSITAVKDREEADLFAARIKPYVRPFPALTEANVKELFPKVKKLKVPSLKEVDLKEISYLAWHDAGANKAYMVSEKNGRLIGIRGSRQNESIKGICAVCNGHDEVELFMSESKKTASGSFVKKGNYICKNSLVCNERMQSTDKLDEWMDRLRL